MKQHNQLNLLIIFCGIVLVGLISIQFYLIRNTYQLMSKTYISDIKKEISPIIDSPEMDSIESRITERVKKVCLKRANNDISFDRFQAEIRKLADSGQSLSQNYLKSLSRDYPILDEIKIRTQVIEMIFETSGVYDTLLKMSDKPIVFLGEDFKGKSYTISTGITESSIEKNEDSSNAAVKYFYKHNQVTDMDISNINIEIWKKMRWMLIAGIILILSVIFLFYWMYRSLIKQKKIAEVKTDFANNISHELKTPVSSLSIAIKSLKLREINQNPQKLDDLVASLERQTKRIQSLTEKVLESSMEYTTDLDKSDIILFLKGIILDSTSENHIIESKIEPEILILKTDIYLLERVIQNLLENAQKYSPNPSVIRLRSYISGSEFLIEIEDNGIGIPENELQKIFEKFYRISEGNRHDIKGLGLGLYLSQKMMKSIGGNISVKSKLNEGSTFTLKIPII